MPVLILLFAVTALLYAAVGFGGGSTYNALLVLHGTDYRIFPTIALVCNLIVASGGAIRFMAADYIRFKRVAPFAFVSVPLAWLGGVVVISETLFIGLLAGVLLISGLLMLGDKRPAALANAAIKPAGWSLPNLGVGGIIGLASGMLGIGGGILLAPYLHLRRWGSGKEIAGAASFFIAVNSLAGLIGQMTKVTHMGLSADILAYWPLPIAVFFCRPNRQQDWGWADQRNVD